MYRSYRNLNQPRISRWAAIKTVLVLVAGVSLMVIDQQYNNRADADMAAMCNVEGC